jgi:hypothetical protein
MARHELAVQERPASPRLTHARLASDNQSARPITPSLNTVEEIRIWEQPAVNGKEFVGAERKPLRLALAAGEVFTLATMLLRHDGLTRWAEVLPRNEAVAHVGARRVKGRRALRTRARLAEKFVGDHKPVP